MANIVIVRMQRGMHLPIAQLMAELIRAGHQTHGILFKESVYLRSDEFDPEEHARPDLPMMTYVVNRSGVSEYTYVWKKASRNQLATLKRVLLRLKPDAVGISCLSATMPMAEEVTAFLRQNFHGLPIIWGGAGPTLEAERAIQHADVVCVGEGEEVILEIADRLDAGAPLSGIAGTWCRDGNGVIQKNPKRPVSDLDRVAIPEWNPRHYTYITGYKEFADFDPIGEQDDFSYPIMTQRGCPFSCSFCIESWYQDEFGKKGSLRRMAPEKAIEELLVAKNRYGYRKITFFDDVFTINPRWLKEFLPLYKREIGLPFFCYTYPSTHNPALLRELVDAGCHAMAMGVQSGSQRLLQDFFNRPTHYHRIVEAAQEIVDAGIPAATFDMIPRTVFDKEDDLRATFELLLHLPKEMDSSFYGKMVYFPGYGLTQKAHDPALLATSENLSEDVYHYYFKLFNLTRTPMPIEKIREIAADERYRRNHHLLNDFLNDDSMLKPYYGSLIQLGIERRKQAEARVLAV